MNLGHSVCGTSPAWLICGSAAAIQISNAARCSASYMSQKASPRACHVRIHDAKHSTRCDGSIDRRASGAKDIDPACEASACGRQLYCSSQCRRSASCYFHSVGFQRFDVKRRSVTTFAQS